MQRVRVLAAERVVALAALAAALLLGSGCGYAAARGRDFAQVLRVDVGVALAFDVDARLGGLLDFGLGGGNSWDAALLYGEPYLGKQVRMVAPGFCRRAIGPTRVWSHTCPSALPPLLANETYELPDCTHLGTRLHEFDIEVEVSAVFVHFRFGLSPGELLDAFAGIFTADLAGDDRGQKPPPFHPEGHPAPPPPRRPPPPRAARPREQPPPEDGRAVDLSAPPSDSRSR